MHVRTTSTPCLYRVALFPTCWGCSEPIGLNCILGLHDVVQFSLCKRGRSEPVGLKYNPLRELTLHTFTHLFGVVLPPFQGTHISWGNCITLCFFILVHHFCLHDLGLTFCFVITSYILILLYSASCFSGLEKFFLAVHFSFLEFIFLFWICANFPCNLPWVSQQ